MALGPRKLKKGEHVMYGGNRATVLKDGSRTIEIRTAFGFTVTVRRNELEPVD